MQYNNTKIKCSCAASPEATEHHPEWEDSGGQLNTADVNKHPVRVRLGAHLSPHI